MEVLLAATFNNLIIRPSRLKLVFMKFFNKKIKRGGGRDVDQLQRWEKVRQPVFTKVKVGRVVRVGVFASR